jgi:hypothetical protein
VKIPDMPWAWVHFNCKFLRDANRTGSTIIGQFVKAFDVGCRLGTVVISTSILEVTRDCRSAALVLRLHSHPSAPPGRMTKAPSARFSQNSRLKSEDSPQKENFSSKRRLQMDSLAQMLDPLPLLVNIVTNGMKERLEQRWNA